MKTKMKTKQESTLETFVKKLTQRSKMTIPIYVESDWLNIHTAFTTLSARIDRKTINRHTRSLELHFGTTCQLPQCALYFTESDAEKYKQRHTNEEGAIVGVKFAVIANRMTAYVKIDEDEEYYQIHKLGDKGIGFTYAGYTT